LEEIRNHHDAGSDVKPDDDLGFDPFHETQKALAELMENEMQIQQQRIFQQQQQQREREEQNRVQHQQTLANLGQQHFSQVSVRIIDILMDIKNILYLYYIILLYYIYITFLILYQNNPFYIRTLLISNALKKFEMTNKIK